MTSPPSVSFTLSQKVRLAAGVFAIYWPIRLYINIDTVTWPVLQRSGLIWVLEIPLTILFFTFWLTVTEWLERRFFGQSKRDFLVDFKWPAQLATLLVAGTLAVVFNLVFHMLIYKMSLLVDDKATQLTTVSPTPPATQLANDDLAKRKLQEWRRRSKANNGLTVLAMLMAFYVAANRRGYKQLTELRVNAEQLKREATQAQFMALKNQVNPHFLFNSLSILSSLVEVDAKLSVRFIKHLSKAYRYILEQRDSERVSLKTELDFLEAYCFLLNIRFDGKLRVLNQILPEDAARYGIAPLTLQLLVENAVKHNQMSQEQPLVVTLETADAHLLVHNPLQPRPQVETSTGLGLENITNRYRLLTDRPVWAGEADGQFVVKIPLLT